MRHNSLFPLPRRGEIWDVDWSPGRGAEQRGIRPALIVQNDFGNQSVSYPNTIVVAISTQGRQIPFHVLIKRSEMNGLDHDSYVKCEQILTMSKERLSPQGPRGRVTAEEMALVDRAIRQSLSL